RHPAPAAAGADGSPTWVAGLEEVPTLRRGEMLDGSDPAALAAALRTRLLELGALGEHAGDHPPLPPPAGGDGPPIWVVAEIGPNGPRAITRELLAKAGALAGPLGERVEVILLGRGEEHASGLAAAGA